METKDSITFEIMGNDLKNLKRFRRQHKNCLKGTACEQFEYSFTPSGLGLVTCVKCSCGQTLYLGDFMDYDSGEYDEFKNRVLTEEDLKNQVFETDVKTILQMRNPLLFRLMFSTDQSFEIIHDVSAAISAARRSADTRLDNCLLLKKSIGTLHETIDNYKDLHEDAKLEKFFSYFEEHALEELNKYNCQDGSLLKHFDEKYDYHENICEKDTLSRWLCITDPEKNYGLFSKEHWSSEELLPILEKYVSVV